MQQDDAAQLAPETDDASQTTIEQTDSTAEPTAELTNGADHTDAPADSAVLDINDPRLNEAYEGSPDADLNEFFLPRDGVYPCTLSLIEGKTVYAKPRSNGQIMVIAPIVATIEWAEEKANGAVMNRSMDIREYVNDMIFEGNATSELGDVLRIVGFPHAARITKRDLAQHAQSVLEGHPQCQIKVRREGYCKQCADNFTQDEQHKVDLGEGTKEYKKALTAASEKSYLKGERAGGWPQDDQGRYVTSVECRECGSEIPARMKKLAFLPFKRSA